MKTSAALIVRDEAACIGGCLESLRGVVNEIVVVDTGSRDGTRQLAKEQGARVFDWAWREDFSAARNHAIEQCSGDVILTIDADEFVVTPAQDARATLEAHDPAVLGLIEIVNLRPEGDSTGAAVDHTARVFGRAYFRYEGAVHEQLAPLGGGAARGVELPLRIHHTGYALSPEEAASKAHRNIALLRRELEAHPDDEYYRYQLAKAWASLGRHKAAAIAFQQALRAIDFTQLPPQGRLGAVGRPVLTGLLCGAAYALMNGGDTPRALALLRQHERLKHEGTQRADFFHALGYACLQSALLVEAEAMYRLSLGLPEDVQGTGSWASWYHLGLIDEARGDMAEAITKHREALHLRPDYTPAFERLRELSLP